MLHGEQGLASEISPVEGRPRITLTDKAGAALQLTLHYNETATTMESE